MMLTGILRALFSSLTASWGFAVLLHAPSRSWLPASIIGGISFTLYWICFSLGVPDPASVFLSALAGSILAQLFARRLHMIATVFITLSIVPMVPGLGLYRCMEYLAQGQSDAGVQTFTAAMVTIVMLALGIGVGGYLFHLAAGQRANRKDGSL